MNPSRGVYIGALYYYIVDYDLDGLIDAGVDDTRSRRRTVGRETPILRMSSSFLSRSTQAWGTVSQRKFPKHLPTKASRVALKYFGE